MNSGCVNPFDDPAQADGYESWYSGEGRRAGRLEKRLLSWMLRKLPESRTILEVGCGTGHFTRWFESRGLRSVGLDVSAAMIAEGARLGKGLRVRGNALELPFGRQSFDLVALITTLEFLSDSAQALEEARRVARRGLILGTINRRSLVGARYARRGGPVWESARLFTPRELALAVRQAVGPHAEIFWKTSLWPLWPGGLPLPWGGFIGMGVLWGQEQGDRHE